MRELKNHIVSVDQASQLTISVLDEPGAGGANHCYRITGFSNPSESEAHIMPQISTDIIFQNGPIPETGVNGITNEALLAIVIDRLTSFQEGPFACRENGSALHYCQSALACLKQRTLTRIKRGVEGSHKP